MYIRMQRVELNFSPALVDMELPAVKHVGLAGYGLASRFLGALGSYL